MSASEVYLWHIWPGRHWPASKAEEILFVKDLEKVATIGQNKIIKHERGDLTAVLNALRNGMTYEELLKVAPGIVPDRLLSAYRHIDKLRMVSINAFLSLLENPSKHTEHLHSQQASMLFPVPTFRLGAAINENNPKLLKKERLTVKEIYDSTAEKADELEKRLASGSLDDLESIRLGRVLYDPFGQSLWSHPFYSPSRVGTLVPSRVKDLLGEREE